MAIATTADDSVSAWSRWSVEYHAAMPDTLVLLIIILVLVVVWRGPRTLPEIGRMLGRGVKSAREEARAMRHDEPDSPDKP